MRIPVRNLFLIPLLTAGVGLILAGRVPAQTFTNLHSFAGTDGAGPYGGLIVSGNTLFGTAKGGGTAGNGTVFRVNTDGTAFTNLHSFTATSGSMTTNSDGAQPYAALVLSGNTLYGTAPYGGAAGHGTIFSVNTDGSDFATVHTFTATSGGNGANSDGVIGFDQGMSAAFDDGFQVLLDLLDVIDERLDC